MTTNPLLVTIADACRMLGVGRTFLYQNVIAPGHVRTAKLGRATRLYYGDLVRYAESLARGEAA
ncbi:helix-turn-helix domain-containing protein [Rhodocista pekingensis]|uniref:Helix-turn-helix domain-containing protein n=1 Tax=Rhodocista pekingensis TaxID=201185 RepID=A0ABW2KUR8_9PROT